MTLEQAVHEYLTRPDKSVPQIVKEHRIGTQSLYDALYRRTRQASQEGGTPIVFRQRRIDATDRAIATQYTRGTPVREIKATLNVGANRIYRIVALLGLKQRRK